jgi:hypothetical protein
VCGVAGAGKSFLVEALRTHHNGWYSYGSYTVSVPHPFDIMNFCQSLFLEFDLPPPEEGKDIFWSCWKYLENHECLVVIDGLRSKEDWDLIEANLIPSALPGGCIIVITREESVARHCATSADAVCRVKGLEAEAARRLFKVCHQPA